MYLFTSAQAWRPGCFFGDPFWNRMEGADWQSGTTWNYEDCRRGHLQVHARTEEMTVSLPSARDQDFRWTRQGANELILSQRTLDIFQEAGLTGFESCRVHVARIKRQRGGPDPAELRLHELRVTGQAELDLEASGFHLERGPCSLCGWTRYRKTTRGFRLREGSWDGSDFFSVPEYPLWILASGRAARVIVENDLKPCVLFTLDEIPFDESATFEERRKNDVERLVRGGQNREDAEAWVADIYAADVRFFSQERKRTQST